MQDIKLETKRLAIIPLDVTLLQLFIADFPVLERVLGLAPSGYDIQQSVKAAMAELLLQARQKPWQYVWHTSWQIVLQAEKRIIGGCSFRGSPDAHGNIEVSYGIQKPYRLQGYMTEALAALLAWSGQQPGVQEVRAETERDNMASRRVLEKNGMVCWQESKERLHYAKAVSC